MKIDVFVIAEWRVTCGSDIVVRECRVMYSLDGLVQAGPNDVVHIESEGIAVKVQKKDLSKFRLSCEETR
jgi:hypothetical protein